MLDGKLWMESEKETGSILYFTLPYNAGKQRLSKIKVTMQRKN
jgi:signal transduction histidine kinase